MHILSLLTLLLVLTLPSEQRQAKNKGLLRKDSVQLAKYRAEIIKAYRNERENCDADQIREDLQTGRLGVEGSVSYAPDSSFKIFVFQVSECGSTCQYEWRSWVHYNLGVKEKSETGTFGNIDSIYRIGPEKFLILENWFERDGPVMVRDCRRAQLLSFVRPVHGPAVVCRYKPVLAYCQEDLVELDERDFIHYDKNSQRLSYLYGNNYPGDSGISTDSIRRGSFTYINGAFVRETEDVIVKQRQQ